MDFLKKLFGSNPVISLLAPSILSGMTFLGQVASAIQSGNVDSPEFHHLMMSSSGLETLILVVVMIAINAHNKDNQKK